jgi:tetratricopeptide (TPR) repeat protein
MRRARWAAAAVLTLALLLRVAAALSLASTPYASHPLVDARVYWEQASELADGGDPFREGFYQPPGYPVLLAALFRLLGDNDPFAGLLLNLALGLAATAMIMALGARLLGSPWQGVAAGLIYTLYPRTLLLELDLLTPALTAVCLLAALLLYRRWPVVAGLLLGGAGVAHPTYLLAAPAFLWVLRRRRRALVLFGLGLVIALLPTTLLNTFRWGHPAPVSHNAGVNLYLGNNPDWKETVFIRPGLPFQKLIRDEGLLERDYFERNRHWLRRTGEELLERPGAVAGALATKALWSVNRAEIPRNEDYRCRTRRGALSWISWLPARYAWVFPLALVGAWVLWRRGGEGRLVLLGWIALHAVLVLFFVCDRYRLATWPLMALAAAAALGELPRWRSWLRRPLPWVALLLPWIPIDPVTGYRESWCLHNEAEIAAGEREFARAESLAEEAVRLDGEDIGAWHLLALSRSRRGGYREAIDAWGEVLARYPEHQPSHWGRGDAFERLGETEAAAGAFREACALVGPRRDACERYAAVLRRLGREEEAREVLEWRRLGRAGPMPGPRAP